MKEEFKVIPLFKEMKHGLPDQLYPKQIEEILNRLTQSDRKVIPMMQISGVSGRRVQIDGYTDPQTEQWVDTSRYIDCTEDSKGNPLSALIIKVVSED